MAVWQKNLETVGADLFQRYRKRLMLPGIAMEIRRDYPGLSIADVFVRVHAGRRIIQDGDDFRALRAIRSGQWEQMHREQSARRQLLGEPRDRSSSILVAVGAVLFAGFCLSMLWALFSAGVGQWLVPMAGMFLGGALVRWLDHSGPPWLGGQCGTRDTSRCKRARDRHDVTASV